MLNDAVQQNAGQDFASKRLALAFFNCRYAKQSSRHHKALAVMDVCIALDFIGLLSIKPSFLYTFCLAFAKELSLLLT